MGWDQAQAHGASGRRITGSAHRDLLFGGSGNDTIVGHRGNDYMEGGAGSDRFVLDPGDGWDCIGDFQGGLGGDLLDLRGWGGIGSLEDVLAHSHQDSDGLVLDFGPRDGVKLMGLSRDDLTADNLRLNASRSKADAVFAASDSGHGDELWGTDGRRAFLLRDIAPGTASSDPQGLVEADGHAYFSADDGVHGRELWMTDGTPGGTRMVADIHPGAAGSGPTALTVVDGRLYFQADDGQHATELWVSDGTAAGTHMVKDIADKPAGSFPYDLTAVGDELFFSATDSEHGRALWRSDGTAAGTVLVKDFFPGGFDPPVPLPIFPGHLTAGGEEGQRHRLFLTGWDGTGSYSQLWVTDGTLAGTVKLLEGLGEDPKSGHTLSLAMAGDTLFFNRGDDLWKSDGTPAGTVLVKDFPSLGFSRSKQFFAFDDQVAFVAGSEQNGYELWTSDGTELGTRMVKDIAPGRADANIANITVVDDTLFFTADDGVHGDSLWRSDGTAAGTRMVTDKAHHTGWTQPTSLDVAGGNLYFSATDSTQAAALFRLDVDRGVVTELAGAQPFSLPNGSVQVVGV
ncbi:ELWxxDGT repeat protein [Azospirillum sp. TSH64]|uniref:ELWxxDGT repeat protein n=1 Tax=Azospirillum sp. TSH64 TaxID=652740 RepID=UPI0013048289|nr:ELWxxDGT repeat protein [Azospirillum sp. TSH64]